MQPALKRRETSVSMLGPITPDYGVETLERTLVSVPPEAPSSERQTGVIALPQAKGSKPPAMNAEYWTKRIAEVKEEARQRAKLLESTIDDHRKTKKTLSTNVARTRLHDQTLRDHTDTLANHAGNLMSHGARLTGHDHQIQYLGVTMEQVVAQIDALGIEVNTGAVTDQTFNDRLTELEATVRAIRATQQQPIIHQARATSVTAEATPFPWFKVLAAASVLGAVGSAFAIHFF